MKAQGGVERALALIYAEWKRRGGVEHLSPEDAALQRSDALHSAAARAGAMAREAERLLHELSRLATEADTLARGLSVEAEKAGDEWRRLYRLKRSKEAK